MEKATEKAEIRKRSEGIHPDTGYVIIFPPGRSSNHAYDRGKQRGQTVFEPEGKLSVSHGL